MELSSDNSIVRNRTWKYLAPSFRVFGDVFAAKFNSVHKLAIGIYDCLLEGNPDFEDIPLVFLLLDKAYKPAQFVDFIKWLKYQEFYVTDYAYDDLWEGNKHMIVLKYPEKYADIYDKFTKGKYSQMYCKQELKRIFEDSPAYDVLAKTPTALNEFVTKLNLKFGTTLKPFEIKGEGAEYDFPLNKKEEFFNYEGE